MDPHFRSDATFVFTLESFLFGCLAGTDKQWICCRVEINIVMLGALGLN